MAPPSGNSNSTHTSSQSAQKELADLVARYNSNNEVQTNPTLNELIYVVVRLADSIRQDPKYQGGWSDLVREVRRRLYGHLNSGSGYQQTNRDKT